MSRGRSPAPTADVPHVPHLSFCRCRQRGTWGPWGLPPTLITFRHFPPHPHLGLHSGMAPSALRQRPCPPPQAAGLAPVLPVSRESNNSSPGCSPPHEMGEVLGREIPPQRHCLILCLILEILLLPTPIPMTVGPGTRLCQAPAWGWGCVNYFG